MTFSRKKRRKAASFVFEESLLFMLSVIIFIASFFLFNSYQKYFLDLNMNAQTNEVADLVATSIIKLSEKSNATNSYIELSFCRPPDTGCLPYKIGEEDYVIYAYNTNITVATLPSHITSTMPLYGLNETMEIAGRVYSSQGGFIINKQGNKIILKEKD